MIICAQEGVERLCAEKRYPQKKKPGRSLLSGFIKIFCIILFCVVSEDVY